MCILGTCAALRLRSGTANWPELSRKACGIATLRAQPLVELGVVEVVTFRLSYSQLSKAIPLQKLNTVIL